MSHMSMVRIAARIPESLATEIQAEADAMGLPFSWAVRRRLSGRGVEIVAVTGRKCKDTLSREAGGIQPTKSGNKDVTRECKSSEVPFDSATHKQVSSPAAPTNSCPKCGALSGHQKWCKGT